jgi:DNA-binding LacI/PurR family transcriptional regulator
MSKTEEILKRSGVSRSTLFRFLRGDNVRPRAKKAIIEAMDELGYKPENRNLLDGIVFEISVMKDFEKFKGFTEVIQGITKRAEEKGIKIQLAIRSERQIERDYEKRNENDAVKGIIILGKDIENEELEMEVLSKKSIPHIFVNRIIDNPDTSYVSVDVRAGAFEIVDYLIKKGHKLIAALGYPDKLRIDRDKLNGYYDAFRKNGLEIPEKYVFKLSGEEPAEIAIDTILNMRERPTAFFGICDSYAMEFINKAHALGLKVPDDIAVAGMDNLDIAQYFKPSLTTVKTPFIKLGALAVDNLLQLITHDLRSVKTIVRHHLFIRESA